MLTERYGVGSLEDNMTQLGNVPAVIDSIPIARQAKMLKLNTVQTAGLYIVRTLKFLYPTTSNLGEFIKRLETIGNIVIFGGAFGMIFLAKKLLKKKKKS